MAKRKGKAGKSGKAEKSGEDVSSSHDWKWFFGSIFSLVRKHGNAVITWFGIGWCVREISLAFIAYAGRTSTASLSFQVLANLSVVWTLSLSVSGLSVTLYLRERRMHRATRDRLTDRTGELERMLDPGRTSSLLTSEGLTRKEDE